MTSTDIDGSTGLLDALDGTYDKVKPNKTLCTVSSLFLYEPEPERAGGSGPPADTTRAPRLHFGRHRLIGL